ncbi:MAG: ABC transporter ATP-binding protein [Phycisphaerales bacterium]|nr:ABC transporter ATP-binding protein [Phycisphaerales bacterium]
MTASATTTAASNASGAPPAIAVRGVSYRYDSTRAALDGIDLVVEPNSLLALLGPNGSGKSTILRLLARLDVPAWGSIQVLGRTGSAVRPLLGVVFQSPSLDPKLTVAENLRCAGRLLGLPRTVGDARMRDLLARLGLADRATDRVGSLSLGLARRVDLCRAVLHEPRVLLLDEPTTGLDPAAREAFLDLLDDLRTRTGLAILSATHLVDEADRADRAVLMHAGRVVADGAPADLRAQLGPRIAFVHGAIEPDAGIPSIAGGWRRRHGGWVADLAENADFSACAAALAASGRSFSMAPPSLADLFAALTGAELGAGEQPETASNAARGEKRHVRG